MGIVFQADIFNNFVYQRFEIEILGRIFKT